MTTVKSIRPMRVLFVDDETPILNALRRTLRRQGS
jgi:hypothetical protein